MAVFVEYKKLKTFPYKHLSKSDQHVVRRFFDSQPFHGYGWEIHLYDTETTEAVLISWDQINVFFKEIAAETGITMLENFPVQKIAFRIESERDLPLSLGVIDSKAGLDELLQTYGASSGKGVISKAKSKKGAAKRSAAMQGWKSQVISARAHLGYTQRDPDEGVAVNFPVFVSIDVEAFEHNHNIITEIGISVLDTLGLPPPPPNEAGHDAVLAAIASSFSDPAQAPKRRSDAIISLIKARHFRVSEHKNMRNGQFVTDAADRFVFGDSEFVPLGRLPGEIGECFRHYDDYGEKRRIVLVGHDVKTDVDYLMNIGYDLANIAGLEVIDTTCMWKAVMNDYQSKGLGPMLYDLGVEFWHLHNAGNDAAYTLQALVKLAEIGLPKEVSGESAMPNPAANTYRPIWQKAENISIKFAEESDNTRPTTFPGGAAPKTVKATSSSEGSGLSMGGDGWD